MWLWRNGKHLHNTTKSFQLSIPPLAATTRVTSIAMKAASAASSEKVWRNGVDPLGCDVWRVLGIRDLSMGWFVSIHVVDGM